MMIITYHYYLFFFSYVHDDSSYYYYHCYDCYDYYSFFFHIHALHALHIPICCLFVFSSSSVTLQGCGENSVTADLPSRVPGDRQSGCDLGGKWSCSNGALVITVICHDYYYSSTYVYTHRYVYIYTYSYIYIFI